jgi:hypothetical protein
VLVELWQRDLIQSELGTDLTLFVGCLWWILASKLVDYISSTSLEEFVTCCLCPFEDESLYMEFVVGQRATIKSILWVRRTPDKGV